MCRWCVRYQKVERIAKTIEDIYGSQEKRAKDDEAGSNANMDPDASTAK